MQNDNSICIATCVLFDEEKFPRAKNKNGFSIKNKPTRCPPDITSDQEEIDIPPHPTNDNNHKHDDPHDENSSNDTPSDKQESSPSDRESSETETSYKTDESEELRRGRF